TTPTTASTTTSSFVPNVCGNGVAEGSEQCDGTDPGLCVQLPPSIEFACEPPSSPSGLRPERVHPKHFRPDPSLLQRRRLPGHYGRRPGAQRRVHPAELHGGQPM